MVPNLMKTYHSFSYHLYYVIVLYDPVSSWRRTWKSRDKLSKCCFILVVSPQVQGRLNEAPAHLSKCEEILQEHPELLEEGEHLPDTHNSCRVLADTYAALGILDQAVKWDAVTGIRRFFGAALRNVMKAVGATMLLQQMGQYDPSIHGRHLVLLESILLVYLEPERAAGVSNWQRRSYLRHGGYITRILL